VGWTAKEGDFSAWTGTSSEVLPALFNERIPDTGRCPLLFDAIRNEPAPHGGRNFEVYARNSTTVIALPPRSSVRQKFSLPRVRGQKLGQTLRSAPVPWRGLCAPAGDLPRLPRRELVDAVGGFFDGRTDTLISW